MKNICANCKHGKRHGRTMVYCILFGIDISSGYDRCEKHKARITIENGNPETIINPKDSQEKQVS